MGCTVMAAVIMVMASDEGVVEFLRVKLQCLHVHHYHHQSNHPPAHLSWWISYSKEQHMPPPLTSVASQSRPHPFQHCWLFAPHTVCCTTPLHQVTVNNNHHLGSKLEPTSWCNLLLLLLWGNMFSSAYAAQWNKEVLGAIQGPTEQVIQSSHVVEWHNIWTLAKGSWILYVAVAHSRLLTRVSLTLVWVSGSKWLTQVVYECSLFD